MMKIVILINVIIAMVGAIIFELYVFLVDDSEESESLHELLHAITEAIKHGKIKDKIDAIIGSVLLILFLLSYGHRLVFYSVRKAIKIIIGDKEKYEK